MYHIYTEGVKGALKVVITDGKHKDIFQLTTFGVTDDESLTALDFKALTWGLQMAHEGDLVYTPNVVVYGMVLGFSLIPPEYRELELEAEKALYGAGARLMMGKYNDKSTERKD